MGRAGNRLLQLLAEHGIPERGVRIYLAACAEGPKTASELARISALGRVEAYRVLRTLEKGGLLRARPGRPMRFEAVAPAVLVDRWIRETADSLHRLEHDREGLLTDWRAELEGTGLDGGPSRFEVLEGRPAIFHFLAKRFGTARREVLVTVSGFALAPAVDGGIDRALREAARRGIQVRVVTEVGPSNLVETRLFSEFADLRHAEGPLSNRAVVIDRAGALVFVSGEEGLGRSGEDQVALWSTSPRFVQRAREYHHRLWNRSVRAEARLAEVDSPATLTVLPMARGREAGPLQRLGEVAQLGMKATGVTALDLNLPELIDAVARQLGRRVAREVSGSSPAEVARGLAAYYREHAMGRLTVERQEPLTLRVSRCFACVQQMPEVGRVLCPALLRTVLETRLGSHWVVSKPDPSRHHTQGCLFVAAMA